jgi:hypothetical protein
MAHSTGRGRDAHGRACWGVWDRDGVICMRCELWDGVRWGEVQQYTMWTRVTGVFVVEKRLERLFLVL